MRKIQKYMIEAITGAFLLLFLFWTIGYFANALLGTKFDIRSCWDGFTTLGGAGILAMVKYIMDSWKNSEDGQKPYGGGTNDIAGAVKPNQTRDAGSVGRAGEIQKAGMGEGVRGSNESDTPRV